MTAKELEAWRLVLSVTQTRASELLGMSRVAYRNLETGRYAIDRRTELACRYLLAKAAGDLDLDANRRFMRAVGRWPR
jgi:DNA-binding XRE family transcriptional regulator